ncbi:flagellar export chaperone FliS [bacterium SGD-2]|nr:flagellar export chaperone FliS [bacterium SGD-2]
MTYSSPYGVRRKSVQAYSDVGLETEVLSASPERLITLLFDGALSAIAKARLHLQSGNIPERGKALSKAIDIVDSGLKAAVNREEGGEVAAALVATYELTIFHLMQANLNADEQSLTQAENILREVGSAWREACDTPKERTPFQVSS